jgi:hypothetical protein
MISLEEFCKENSIIDASNESINSYGISKEWLRRHIRKILCKDGRSIECNIKLFGRGTLTDRSVRTIFADYLEEIEEVIIIADRDTMQYVHHIPYDERFTETLEIHIKL